MLFHEAIARALADQGVTTVFGVLGDANLYMMDSFQRQAGGHYYSACNENGAVLAANGYARTSGQLGVATVTHGPALTNTVTALAEGVRDRTPIVLLAGDMPVADKTNLQNIPQREVVLASGAGFEQVRTPQTVAEDLATAIFRAHAESRPVVLNVPVDFQWEEIEYQPVRAPADRARRRSGPTPPLWMPRSASSPRPGRPVIVAGWRGLDARGAGRAPAAGRPARRAGGHHPAGQGPVPRRAVQPRHPRHPLALRRAGGVQRQRLPDRLRREPEPVDHG